MKGLFITGTNTAVGKTVIGCQIIKTLRAEKLSVKVRKPVETDCNPDPKDALILNTATGSNEPLTTVCRYQFNTCASAALAAEKASEVLTLDDFIDACRQNVNSDDFVIVEGAGGFYSPLTQTELNADLAQALSLDVILVVKDELGCLSHALLAIEAAQKRRLKLAAVVLNTIEPNTLENFTALKHYTDAPIFKNDNYFYQTIARLGRC